MIKILVLCLLSFGFVACQVKPTKITVQDEAIFKDGKKIDDVMKEQPAILDARSSFDFNLNHVPGSVNVRWEDFSQADHNSRGLLDSDLFALARRLSLIGIDLDRPVVVLGKLGLGMGEEGRVAWTLKVLGVKRVYTADIKTLRTQNPKEEPPIQNRPYWKPEVDETLWVDMKTFKDIARNNVAPRKLPSRARSAALGVGARIPASDPQMFGQSLKEVHAKAVVLDVRSVEEFDIENLTQKKNVSVPVSQMAWTEFFNSKGAPKTEVLAALEAKGITKDNYIFVISKHGVRSGAVTYALRQLGWTNVTNVAGGYEQWSVVR